MNDTSRAVARALIDIGAVGFRPQDPITFASGIRAPMYVDNRRFPFHPAQWRIVIEAFKELIDTEGLVPDVIAGVEAAGIPHSAALGFFMGKPSVFVRKKPKEHGTKNRVEGGSVAGKRVLLIEDLVTTGGSSLQAVEALKNEGALVSDVAVIVTYGFPESDEAFKSANVGLHALTDVPTILAEAQQLGLLSESDANIINAWARDPHTWEPPA